MKKAVITLLGLVSHTKPDYVYKDGEVQKVFVDKTEEDQAIYRFSEELDEYTDKLSRQRYISTLPLLIDVFEDISIVPVSTSKAMEIQRKTLEFLELDSVVLENTVQIDDSNYGEIFQKISTLLQNEDYDSFIVDLTHGFRHLPILMLVNLIITSIKDVDKIEHILFAKEIVPYEEYEIIDLLEYIGIAKFSFVLENFNTNYTVGNRLIFRNQAYQGLVDKLRIISGHILANSIKALLEEETGLIRETINALHELKNHDENITTFGASVVNIIHHLEEIDELSNEEDYFKLFHFSQMMKDREYLLNSITLLNESIGMYCAKIIYGIVPGHIQEYLSRDRASVYELAHQSKHIVRLGRQYDGPYLFNSDHTSRASKHTKNKSRHTQVEQKIIKHFDDHKYKELKKIIKETNNLRNNLAHGNTQKKISNVKKEISRLLRDYKSIISL